MFRSYLDEMFKILGGGAVEVVSEIKCFYYEWLYFYLIIGGCEIFIDVYEMLRN